MFRVVAAAVAVLSVATGAAAQPALPSPRAVAAHRLTVPLKVDRRLDDGVYATTSPVGDFLQQEPFEGQPATEKTEAWVFFDDTRIYVSSRRSRLMSSS